MRVLLLGARGMLGTALALEAPAHVALHAAGRAECDVGDVDSVRRLLDRVSPSLVINASAYTAVDRAEAEHTEATRINGYAVGALGELCAARRVRVLHYSTDYVFPGTASRPYRETDAVRPVNAYGTSKLIGERLLAESGADWLLIRTQWLFGAHGRSFPRTMWERARARHPTRVVDDQLGRPTCAVDLARASWGLVAAAAAGVFHVANEGQTTWFGLAERVFALAGASDCLTACATSEFPTPAARPANSVLDTSKLENILGGTLPRWERAVDHFVQSLSLECGMT